MANSTIRIVFSELAEPTSNGLNLLNQICNFKFFKNTTINVQESFKLARVNPFQCPIGLPPDNTEGVSDKPFELKTVLIEDYPSLFTAIVDTPISVLVTALEENVIFTGGENTEYLTYIVKNETANPNLIPIKVVGFNDDRYLINNPILLTITSSDNVTFYKIVINNLTNQKTSTDFISYPDFNGFSNVRLEAIIKSLFDYPSDANGYIINDQLVPNANKCRVRIFYKTLDPETEIESDFILGLDTIKTFIRGGKRTSESNQSLLGNQILTPCAKLPLWEGYETAEYYLDNNNLIRKRLLIYVPSSRYQFLRSKGCNEVYVKFLNQNGGYSNWLFESHLDKESNKSLGGFVRNNKADDLGNEVDNKLDVNSKVPKDYRPIINDLIVSPEIYVMIDGVYKRVRSIGNSISYDSIKRSYNVNINFDFDYRFNPSLLWSN
jgi:hypothetical protein